MSGETKVSSYALYTAGRVLERLGLHIPTDELQLRLQKKDALVFAFLNIPIKNIRNNIIFQQAYDYQVYVQKLFIDYQLSPEYEKPPGSPGENTREELNDKFNRLISMVDELSKLQTKSLRLISDSQAWLIGTVKAHGGDLGALKEATKDEAFVEEYASLSERVRQMEVSFCSERKNFHDIILESMANFSNLSESPIDGARVVNDLENLVFYEINPKGIGS